MGNAALKQHVVRLLEQHAPLVVKDGDLQNVRAMRSKPSLHEDLPYDELLALSVLGISVTLQRLELQDATGGSSLPQLLRSDGQC